MLRRHLLMLTVLSLAAAEGVSTQGPAAIPRWSGWARCQVDVAGPDGYTDQQIHTWRMTGGAPTVEGAFRVYAGTWSVVGGGSFRRTEASQTLVAEWATNVPSAPAPIAVFVRASDGRMLIQARHAQLRSAGAVAGYQQQTIDGKPQRPAVIASEAFEWQFPSVDAAASTTRISGASKPDVNGRVGFMQPAGSRGTASCTWQFGSSTAVMPPPPALAARPVPAAPAPRAGSSATAPVASTGPVPR